MLISRKARVISWILLICCFIGASTFLVLNVNRHLNSDMSSELVFAEHLLREGKFLSRNWYYSTELSVVGTHLVFAPLILLFSDWYFVRIVGSIVLYLIMLVSAYYVCRQARMQAAFPFVGILMMLPLSQPYFDNILRGVHYIPYICNSFFLLGMALHFMHTPSKKMRITLVVLGALLSFLVGMEGMRLVLTFALPAACVLIALCLMENQKHQSVNWTSEPMRFVTIMGVFILCILGGCLLNIAVLSKIYEYSTFSNLSFADVQFPLQVVNDMLKFWGYRTGEVFSVVLLHNVAAAALVVAVVVAAVRCCIKEEVPVEQRVLGLLYVSGITIYLMVQACSTAPNYETYHLPISVFGFLTLGTLLCIRVEWKKFRTAVLWVLVVIVIGSGGLNYIANSSYDRNEDLRDLTEYLVDDEYDAGYAAFWDGNILKELSGGRFEMYVFSPAEDAGIDDIDKWMQEKSHATNPPEGRVFILVHADRLDFYGFRDGLSPSDIVYEVGEYQVYGYEDYESMKWAMEIAREEYYGE